MKNKTKPIAAQGTPATDADALDLTRAQVDEQDDAPVFTTTDTTDPAVLAGGPSTHEQVGPPPAPQEIASPRVEQDPYVDPRAEVDTVAGPASFDRSDRFTGDQVVVKDLAAQRVGPPGTNDRLVDGLEGRPLENVPSLAAEEQPAARVQTTPRAADLADPGEVTTRNLHGDWEVEPGRFSTASVDEVRLLMTALRQSIRGTLIADGPEPQAVLHRLEATYSTLREREAQAR